VNGTTPSAPGADSPVTAMPAGCDQAAALGSVLRMIRRDIDRAIAREAHSALAKDTITSLTLILDELADYFSSDADPEVERSRAGMIEELATAPAAAPQLAPARDLDDRSGLARELSARLAAAPTAAPRVAGSSLIADLAAAELAALDRRRAAMAARKAADDETLSRIEVEITPRALDAYFASSLEFKGLRTQSSEHVLGGYSKDTYLLSTLSEAGARRDIVLRRDLPFGPTERSAADEFDVLLRLWSKGFPVPRPLAAVHDKGALGQPFLIVERVQGENAAPLFDADPALARAVSLQLAAILGKLHALDPRALGLAPEDSSPAQQVRRNLAQWQSFWRRNRQTAAPLAEAAFAWLEAHVPDDVERLVPVHGDARQHNLLIKGGDISALLDWEYVHAGDAAEDLEYSRMYLEPYVSWKEFLDTYRAAGGARAGESSARYYEVFRALRNLICCDVMWHGFATDRYPVNKLALAGLVIRRDFLRGIAQALLHVAA
jgi:aminoglycoside phosphotransferase (APT) family kinase protein